MDEVEAVKIPVQIDVSAISSGLKIVAAQIAQVKASLTELAKTPAIAHLGADLTSAAGSANRLANALASVAKGYDQVAQSSAKSSGLSVRAAVPKHAAVSQAFSGAEEQLKKLRGATGRVRTEAQIHAEHLAKIREHALAVAKTDTSRDVAQMSGTGQDIWQKRADAAEKKYGRDVAAGVDPEIAAEARDRRLAQIRAERDNAHRHKIAEYESLADTKEAAQFKAGLIAPAEYQKYLSTRIGQVDPSSTKFAELTARLKVLEAKQTPTEQVKKAIAAEGEDRFQRQRDKIEEQVKKWTAAGADPSQVAKWRDGQVSAIDEREKKANLANDDAATKKQLATLKADFTSGLIDAKAYQAQLKAIAEANPAGSSASNAALTAIGREDRKIESTDRSPRLAEDLSRSISDALGRGVEKSISRWDRTGSRRSRGSALSEVGNDVLSSGAGSIVRTSTRGLEQSILSGFGSLFRRFRGQTEGSPTNTPWSEHFNAQQGGLGSLPSMLTQIKGGFSGLLSTLTKGFGQAASGLQSLLALSGAEGKQRQRHSLFGGLLGGVAGSLVGNWYGGFNLGSAIGGLFAEGGIPPVGVPSIVGEHGPELFVPSTQGRVVSNRELTSMRFGQGGQTQSVAVTVNHYGDIHGGDDIQRMYTSIPMAVVNALPTAKSGV